MTLFSGIKKLVEKRVIYPSVSLDATVTALSQNTKPIPQKQKEFLRLHITMETHAELQDLFFFDLILLP